MDIWERFQAHESQSPPDLIRQTLTFLCHFFVVKLINALQNTNFIPKMLKLKVKRLGPEEPGLSRVATTPENGQTWAIWSWKQISQNFQDLETTLAEKLSAQVIL